MLGSLFSNVANNLSVFTTLCWPVKPVINKNNPYQYGNKGVGC